MASRYKLLNNVLGWIVFAIAAFTYISTIEPTTSFWDCGEYIACSYKLEVGHPPGAPTFLLLGRFFSLFAGDPSQVAMMINVMSALSSAFTILFMFWTLTMLGRKLAKAVDKVDHVDNISQSSVFGVFAAAIIGSLAYTFSDSFWFSAVEGEVYAMSSFFTALVFWAILKWDADDSEKSDKWIVFIAYMMGLSVGVHLLNLLAIPAIVMIVYFKKFTPTRKGLIIAGLIAIGLLGVIQNGIIPGVVQAAANYELFFVNGMGLLPNGGTIVYFLLLIAVIVTGFMYTNKGGEKLFKRFTYVLGLFFALAIFAAFAYGKVVMTVITAVGLIYLVYYYRNNRQLLNTILLSFSVLMIGYSTFFVLVIRSQANTPMDENNPENAISLLSYLNREQYGDWPILYGPYYNAPLDADNYADDGSPVYALDEQLGEYVIIDARKQSKYNFAGEMSTIFPRMWENNQRSHVGPYEEWGNVAKNNTKVKLRNPQTGQVETFKKPTMWANLTYFWNYQVQWMYMRYFWWNFAGRQNDIQGHGSNPLDGHWQSGIQALSDVNLNEAPPRLRDNPANNKFFYLPFLLGFIGLIFHFMRDWKNALVVFLLFMFTGLAIVIYLNQYPLQPRERDYAYAGSFYAYAIWIGLGAFAVIHFLRSFVGRKDDAAALTAAQSPMLGLIKVVGDRNEAMGKNVAAVLGTLLCAVAPFLMASGGWDDHNRSNRFTARDYAGNYLATCAKNAVLFTNGDNDTFPLWYEQEVEGYRTDVRVLNLSLLNTDWYIDQAARKAYDSDRVPFSLPRAKYRGSNCDQVFIDREGADKVGAMSARELMDLIIKNDPKSTRVRPNEDDNGDSFMDTTYVLPTNRVYIPVNKALVKANGTVPANTPDSLIADRVEWTINKGYLLKADLMILDLLASFNWERPVYFAVTAGGDSYLNLDEWFNLEGLAYRLVPMKANKRGIFGEEVGCNTALMYENIMKKFRWGGLDIPGAEIYMDENNLRFTTNQRLQMMSLAKLLNDEGKSSQSVEVLDRMQSVMPANIAPLEPAMVYGVEGYYKAGAIEKANKLSRELFNVCAEEYRYYTKVGRETKSMDAFEQDLGRLGSAMEMLAQYAMTFGQNELAEEFKGKLTPMGLGQRLNGPPMPMNAPPPMNMDSLRKAMEAMSDSTNPNKAPDQ